MSAEDRFAEVVLNRGGHPESRLRASIVALRGEDRIFGRGTPDEPFFIRSAAKPFQAASALNVFREKGVQLPPDEIAILCASHNSEERHLEAASKVLARGGFTADDLQCGAHPPIGKEMVMTLARRNEEAGPLHNNCSGKHAGMLLTAQQLDADPSRYLEEDHPVQKNIHDAVRRLCGCHPPFPDTAIDGCSAPTFRMPLFNLARGFAQVANAERVESDYVESVTAIRDAMVRHPGLIGGNRRFDTDLMAAGKGRFVAKIGAEGVIGCGVAGMNIGIAIKMEDGATRGYEAILPVLLKELDLLLPAEEEVLAYYLDPVRRNHRKLDVGRVEIRL